MGSNALNMNFYERYRTDIPDKPVETGYPRWRYSFPEDKDDAVWWKVLCHLCHRIGSTSRWNGPNLHLWQTDQFRTQINRIFLRNCNFTLFPPQNPRWCQQCRSSRQNVLANKSMRFFKLGNGYTAAEIEFGSLPGKSWAQWSMKIKWWFYVNVRYSVVTVSRVDFLLSVIQQHTWEFMFDL